VNVIQADIVIFLLSTIVGLLMIISSQLNKRR